MAVLEDLRQKDCHEFEPAKDTQQNPVLANQTATVATTKQIKPRRIIS